MMLRKLLIDSHMTYGELCRYAASLGIPVSSAKLGGELNGVYDSSVELILIDHDILFTQKRCTLVHELIHWAYKDSACDPIFHSREENRTRRETALTLINPLEYAIAENMFDDPYQIARELDVTMQIIEDYHNAIATQIRHDFLSRATA